MGIVLKIIYLDLVVFVLIKSINNTWWNRFHHSFSNQFYIQNHVQEHHDHDQRRYYNYIRISSTSVKKKEDVSNNFSAAACDLATISGVACE